HAFADFLAKNSHHFDWLLDNIFPALSHSQWEIIRRCLAFLGGKDFHLLESIIRKATNHHLYLEVTKSFCSNSRQTPEAIGILVSHWLSRPEESTIRECPREILEIVDAFGNEAAKFIILP